jgi:hypothetical protein
MSNLSALDRLIEADHTFLRNHQLPRHDGVLSGVLVMARIRREDGTLNEDPEKAVPLAFKPQRFMPTGRSKYQPHQGTRECARRRRRHDRA